MSSYKMRSFRSLKEAVSALVNAAGGIKVAAGRCRVQGATLFRYTDDSDENRDRHMPVDIVVTLERVAGTALVTEHLAEQAGCLLLPAPSEDVETSLGINFAETGEKVSILFSDWARFLANDGIIDPGEAKKLLQDNIQLVRVLLRMRTDLEARMAEQYGKEQHG